MAKLTVSLKKANDMLIFGNFIQEIQKSINKMLQDQSFLLHQIQALSNFYVKYATLQVVFSKNTQYFSKIMDFQLDIFIGKLWQPSELIFNCSPFYPLAVDKMLLKRTCVHCEYHFWVSYRLIPQKRQTLAFVTRGHQCVSYSYFH